MLLVTRYYFFEQITLLFILILGLLVGSFYISYCNYSSFCLYIEILLIPILLSYFKLKDKNGVTPILYYILPLFILASVMSFRAQTGIDDLVYKKIFEGANNASISQYFSSFGVENGYLLLNYLLFHLTGGNYNISQSIIVFISFYFWSISAQKLSIGRRNFIVYILLIWSHYYFFVLSAGLVRIFFAIPIVLYALNFVWECNLKKFLLWIFIASLFHLSSLSMIVFIPFIIKDEYWYKHWILYILISAVLICGVFILIAQYLIPILDVRYIQYGEIQNLSISIGAFDTLPILFLSMMYYRKLKGVSLLEKRKYIIGMVLMSFSIIFSIASSMVPLGRLIFYANLGIIIIGTFIFNSKKCNLFNLQIKAIFIIYSIFYVMYTIFLNPKQTDTLFPYISYFY